MKIAALALASIYGAAAIIEPVAAKAFAAFAIISNTL